MKKGIDRKILCREQRESPIVLCRSIRDNNMIFKDARWTIVTIGNYLTSYNVRGSIYYNLEMYKKSISEYTKALKIKITPSEISYFIPYGSFYKNSLTKYNSIIENINIHLKKAYWGNGNYYSKKNLYLKAIKNYKKAVKLTPDDISLRNILGYIYILQNMYQEAIDEFKKAIKIDPNHIQSRINLASVYYKKEMVKEVIFECKYILRIDSSNNYAKQMLEAIKNKGKEGGKNDEKNY